MNVPLRLAAVAALVSISASSANSLDTACECALKASGYNLGTAGAGLCFPASLQITIGFGNVRNGQCATEHCTALHCSASIVIDVQGNAPCRFKALKNTSTIGGGWLPNGGQAFTYSDSDIACGDFDVFAVVYGPNDDLLADRTFLCEQCAANGG
jgi:hypothetical protein